MCCAKVIGLTPGYFSLIYSWNNTFIFDWSNDNDLEFFTDSARNSDFCCGAVWRYHWTKLAWSQKWKTFQHFHRPIPFLDTNGEDSTLLFPGAIVISASYLQHRFREQLMTHSFSNNTKKHTRLHCIHITAFTHFIFIPYLTPSLSDWVQVIAYLSLRQFSKESCVAYILRL